MRIELKKIAKYFWIVLITAISFSCISTKSLVIEIPQQSKKDLPDDIQSLTLVTRTIDEKYSNLEADSLQKLFYIQNFNYDSVIYDQQAVDTTLKALGDLLFESERYDIVIPEDRFLEFEKNSFFTTEMPFTEVKELCEIYNTDAVLSLDYFKTKVFTQYTKESFFNPATDGFSEASAAQLAVYYEALFRIYDPISEKVLLREFLRDTVIWEDADISPRTLFNRLTPVKSALSEAGIAVALDFSEIISTTWNEEKRKYFASGDKDLKNASILVSANNWESAIVQWKKLAESGKSKAVKSKAEYNLAVAYELQGDLNQAIAWALKSYDSMYRLITYEYLEILERRKNELKKHLK